MGGRIVLEQSDPPAAEEKFERRGGSTAAHFGRGRHSSDEELARHVEGPSRACRLVYIAAFALDEGESLDGLSKQGPAPAGAAAVRPPDDHGFLWIDRDGFAKAFAADVDPTEASVMAAVQKPLSVDSFTAKSGPPAWKTPSIMVHGRNRRPDDSATGGRIHG